MELKIYRDTVNAMGIVCDTPLEVPLETEILIPDYLPAVFKIVKTFVHRVVLQKQLQAGHLLVEGYFRLEVLYQGEDQNLCTVEQKVTFSKQHDVKGCEDVGVAQECQIDVSGEVQYINCRALSQRRLDVRGAYNLQVHAMCAQRQEMITALAEQGIQQKNVTVPAVQVIASREKQFTLEEPAQLDGPPEVILHTQGAALVHEARIIAGKAVVKGELQAVLVYREQGGQEPKRRELTLPFNQVVEMEAADDTAECQALVEMIGCAVFDEAGEGAETRLSCTCLVTVRALRPMEFIGVSDCFSTQVETQTSYRELVTDTLMEMMTNTVEVRTDGRLPDDSLQVLECFAECGAPELVAENDRTAIRGKAVAHLICRNALGEIDCYDKTGEYTLPKRYDALPQEITASLHAVCEGVQYTQTGGQAAAELTVRVQGYLCKRQKSRLLQEVICTDPLESDDDIALRVYYAAAGEDVFDIAKRYHASPVTISALAGIEGGTLDRQTRLLIPQAR